MNTNEPERAKQWADRVGLTTIEVAELTGYSRLAVYWFFRGETPTHGKGNDKVRKIRPWVWQRFKRACAAVDYEIKSGKKFDW